MFSLSVLNRRYFPVGDQAISINQVNYGGGSAFFSPWGEILAIAGDEETILMTEADPSQLTLQPENHFEILAGRQPHLYTNDAS